MPNASRIHASAKTISSWTAEILQTALAVSKNSQFSFDCEIQKRVAKGIESHVSSCCRNFNYHNDSNEDLRDAIIVNEATELCPSRTLI